MPTLNTIQSTRVSTPTVNGYISICKGFNLFSDGKAIDLMAEWNMRLCDEEPTVAMFKVHIGVGFGVYAGICGPAYAADIKVQGASDSSHIHLNASESEILAGFEMGFGVRLILTFDVQQLIVDARWVSDGWSSHLEVQEHWASAGRYGFDWTIDLMTMIAEFLLKAGKTPVVSPARFPSGMGLAMIDSDLNGLATAGQGAVAPNFMLMINVLDKFPVGRELIAALDKMGASMVAGPTFSLSAPTTVDIKKVATNGVEYAVTAANSAIAGDASGPSLVGANRLQLTLRHSSSISLSYALGFTVTILKIFSKSKYTDSVDFLKVLGITPRFGPFDHVIEADYGATGPAARASQSAPRCCYNVVLDKPQMAAAR